MNDPRHPFPQDRQPIFNLPAVVLGVIGVLALVHLYRTAIADPQSDFAFVITFAFIPARVTESALIATALPGGEGAVAWSFVTYAFLHGDWSHLIFNVIWLAAFGSPLAWRFGAARFVIFLAIGAAAGAALHLVLYPSSMTPLVGASAAISACMAGASRFAFSAGGPMRGFGGADPSRWRQPAPPLLVALSDRRVLTFLAVWFGLNLLFGLLPEASGVAGGAAIAWEAHIGGFLAGLLLFPLFDPVRRRA